MKKFGVVVKKGVSSEDSWGGGYSTDYHNELIEFDTEKELVEWIEANNHRTINKETVVKYLSFDELKAEITINIALKA